MRDSRDATRACHSRALARTRAKEGWRLVEQEKYSHKISGKIYAPVPFWFGSLRLRLMHTTIEILPTPPPSSQDPFDSQDLVRR